MASGRELDRLSPISLDQEVLTPRRLMRMLEHYVKKILASRVYDVAIESPLQDAPYISKRLSRQVALKREDMQPVHSFKLRGSYNKMVQLPAADRGARRGGRPSAGNHAQGVALAAGRLGIKAHIVMGRNTPSIKINAVRNLGGRIVLRGDTYEHAAEHAAALAERRGYVLVHPYDDADVIAGQGTVGMEIMNQHPGPDAIFVPVGGGGLIAGIAAYVKYLRPRTRIIGVEAEGSACLAAALKAGRRVRLPFDTLDLFAEGVSVAQVGRQPFKIAKTCVDGVVTVSIDEICAAVKDVFDDTRAVAEPAGALAVAGLKKYAGTGRRGGAEHLVAVISGANVNFDRLRHISERARTGGAPGGDLRRHNRGATRQLPAFLQGARQALGDRIQLPVRGRRPGARVRGFAGEPRREPTGGGREPGACRLPGSRYDRQRSRQAACAAHGWWPGLR